MNILIECSMFVALQADGQSGAFFDVSQSNVTFNFCVFRDVSTNYPGDETYKCAGAIFKANGFIGINFCDFSYCRYSPGTNNKGGNVVFLYLATFNLKLCAIYRCSDSNFGEEAGDSVICGNETYQIAITDMNATNNFLTMQKGSIIYETVTLKKEQIISRCQIISCEGHRILWEEYCLSILNTIFYNNTFEDDFTYGFIKSTLCCFQKNSNFYEKTNNTYIQCTTDNNTVIENQNYDVCNQGREISFMLNRVFKLVNKSNQHKFYKFNLIMTLIPYIYASFTQKDFSHSIK